MHTTHPARRPNVVGVTLRGAAGHPLATCHALRAFTHAAHVAAPFAPHHPRRKRSRRSSSGKPRKLRQPRRGRVSRSRSCRHRLPSCSARCPARKRAGAPETTDRHATAPDDRRRGQHTTIVPAPWCQMRMSPVCTPRRPPRPSCRRRVQHTPCVHGAASLGAVPQDARLRAGSHPQCAMRTHARTQSMPDAAAPSHIPAARVTSASAARLMPSTAVNAAAATRPRCTAQRTQRLLLHARGATECMRRATHHQACARSGSAAPQQRVAVRSRHRRQHACPESACKPRIVAHTSAPAASRSASCGSHAARCRRRSSRWCAATQ